MCKKKSSVRSPNMHRQGTRGTGKQGKWPKYSLSGKTQGIGKFCQNIKPIFHLKTGLRWVPDANENYTKNMKCTCPTRKIFVGTQRNLYFTGLRLGFTLGKTQLLGFASGKNVKNWRHLTQKIPTCWYPQRKSLGSGLLPNANPRVVNSLILKVKDILTFTAKISIFLELDKSANSVLSV